MADARVEALIYEPRYAAARELAQRQATRGVAVFAADGCMVRLWRGPLTRWLDGGEAAIAGLTSYSDFAMARDCARERGLDVLREEWHRGAAVTLVSWRMGTS